MREKISRKSFSSTFYRSLFWDDLSKKLSDEESVNFLNEIDEDETLPKSAMEGIENSYNFKTPLYEELQQKVNPCENGHILSLGIGDIANLYKLKYVCCMVRQARLDAPGVLHHVMARGIEQRPIFIDDCDMDEFIRRLSDLAQEGELIACARC